VFKPDFHVLQLLSKNYRVVNMHHTSPNLLTFLPHNNGSQQTIPMAASAGHVCAIYICCLCYDHYSYKRKDQQQLQRAGWRGLARARKCVSMQEVFQSLGPNYFQHSFQMSYKSFNKLLEIDSPGICQLSRKPGSHLSMLRHAPNSMISPAQRLGVYLQIAAGTSVSDVMLVFGISQADVSKSIWVVTKAINQCRAFYMAYLTCHNEQKRIAQGFYDKSAAGFCCCAGALDGILIWTHRPSEANVAAASRDIGKFFCGQKHKYGLNMQAICDAQGRFLDVLLMFPASTSDIPLFESASIYQKLQDGLLAPGLYNPLSSHCFLTDSRFLCLTGLCLFGDNAYINSPFMATPYSGTKGGIKDAYNFCHLQLQINIECAFGHLVHWWGILWSLFPQHITLKKTIALVMVTQLLHK
jgi:DDE superfamily endonuclease